MTKGDESAPSQRRMVRCPEGHIFDAAAREDCPTCGAKASSAEAPEPEISSQAAEQTPSPPSPQRRLYFIIGGAALVIVLIAAIMLRGEPKQTTVDRNSNPTSVADTQQTQREEKSARGIVGAWEMDVPTPQGAVLHWTIEFGDDSRYKFNDATTGASHEGTYQAANGEWSINGTWTRNPVLPAGSVYTDGGTYRLPTSDALELGGRAGVGVWKRISR